nr:hypothetical protein [Smithellaceae bacterium]
MENTCHFPHCEFARFHKFKKAEQCCNFKETFFTSNAPGADQTPKVYRDCAPVRTLLMIQDLYNRDIGVQQALEQQRNVTLQVISKFNEMIDRANERLRELPNGMSAQSISRIELP